MNHSNAVKAVIIINEVFGHIVKCLLSVLLGGQVLLKLVPVQIVGVVLVKFVHDIAGQGLHYPLQRIFIFLLAHSRHNINERIVEHKV